MTNGLVVACFLLIIASVSSSCWVGQDDDDAERHSGVAGGSLRLDEVASRGAEVEIWAVEGGEPGGGVSVSLGRE